MNDVSVTTLVCDDIRQEVEGKASIMGVYNQHIVVSCLPYIFPKLGFFSSFKNLPEKSNFSFVIVTPEGVRQEIINDVKMKSGSEGNCNVLVNHFEVLTEGFYEAISILNGQEYSFKFKISVKH